MREIKFRAWNPENKSMTEIFDLEDVANVDGMHIVQTDSPIMQFTGLKDKNEKEIYEGDIVSNEDYDVNAHCCNNLGNKIVEWSIGDGMWVGMIGEVVEVIGNIYENHSLLEEEKNE